MKHLIVIILFIFSCNCIAQSWCSQGAEWVYDYSFLPAIGYVKVVYEKDTVINQHVCNKLTSKLIYKLNSSASEIDTMSYYGPLYVYTTTDTVYFSWYNSPFYPLYIFNTEVGDTLNFNYFSFCYNQNQIKQVITDKGVKIINGDTLRFYSSIFLSPVDINLSFITIIEKIGPVDNYLFPLFSCKQDFEISFLKCYQDSNFPNYLPPYSNSCNYYFTGTEEIKDNLVYLSPNPAYNTLNISTSNNEIIEGVYIYDISGMLLNTFLMPVNQVDSSIDINYLKKGMYLIQIKTADGKSTIKKFIKQA